MIFFLCVLFQFCVFISESGDRFGLNLKISKLSPVQQYYDMILVYICIQASEVAHEVESKDVNS